MIKKRNIFLQVLLCIVTFGFYTIYWFYSTSDEMLKNQKRTDSAVLWAVLYCIPPFSLYSYYKQAELFETFAQQSLNRWVIFFLWVLFPPAAWLIVQLRLNEESERSVAQS